MAHEFKLSEFGLKLIKAYEGFRPIETTLVSGQRVIGYGHKYSPDEEAVISRETAEEILKEDLEPYEAMINESIYAPLTQSQFDALVSLSFNIGPRAFLSSTVMHALNNGRPLEAAAAFDEWRKSVIDGETYVVDALVRRRTAEKAMFLKPAEGIVAAPRNEVPPKSDRTYTRNEEEMPVYGRYKLAGVVARAPYDKPEEVEREDVNIRRREDGVAGALTLSEIVPDVPAQSPEPVEIDDAVESSELPETEEGLSPIALAAAEVSERLEALIGDRAETPEAPVASTPDIKDVSDEKDVAPSTPVEAETIEDIAKETAMDLEQIENMPADVPEPANDGTHAEYRRPGRARPAQVSTPSVYISPSKTAAVTPVPQTGSGAYWTALILGATLLGGGAVRWFLSPKNSLDALSAFLAPVATIVGGMIVLGALYYLVKSLVRKN